MSRPEAMLKKMYCTHGFPPLMCNSCAGQALCVHGMLGNCLLCGPRGSGSWLNKMAVGAAKSPVPSPVRCLLPTPRESPDSMRMERSPTT